MAFETKRPDVAVFIDFENVYVSVRDKLDANPNFETIMDRCDELGRVVIARAYADWYRYPRVTSALYANGIEPMYVPTYYYDKEMGRTGRAIKNSVDMNLCIDAMRTLFTNTNITKFVLITGDRDFIPLVNSIRQQGKDVIIIGIGGAASTHLAQSADEFIFYEQLVGAPTARPMATRKPEQVVEAVPSSGSTPADESKPAPLSTDTQPDIYDVLVEAVHLVRERGYVSTLGSLKLVMKELMGGDFKESRYRDVNGRPFAKFKDFVLDAERRTKVIIFTSGTVNEVFLPGEDPHKLSQFAADLKEEPDEATLDTTLLNNGRPRSSHPADADSPPSSSASRRRRRRSRSQRNAAKAAREALAADVAPDDSEAGEQSDLEQPVIGDEPVADVKIPAHSEFAEILGLDVPSEAEPVVAEGTGDHTEDTIDTVVDPLDEWTEDETVTATKDAPDATEEMVPTSDLPAEDDGQVPEEEDGTLIGDIVHDAESPVVDEFDQHDSELASTEQHAVDTQDETSAEVAADDTPIAEVGTEDQEVETEGLPAETSAAAEQAEARPSDDGEATAPQVDSADESSTTAAADMLSATDFQTTFSDEEWQAFTTMMQGFPKPVSFANIFDSLRELRKNQQLIRTNEQLRTMVKQAIHDGLLERRGRGKRIYYELKRDESKQPEEADQT